MLVLCTSSDDAFMFCAKFHENISKGFRVIKRTRNHDGRTDGRTDRRTDKVITIGLPPTLSGEDLIRRRYPNS